MVALAEGTKAPEIALNSLEGESYSLNGSLKASPYVVAAFFKAGCPVCQLTFPFLERLQKAHPQMPIFGISQDDESIADQFKSDCELSFPILLDEALQSSVDYDLTNVPSIFLIRQDGTIEQTIVGFAKDDLERLHSTVGTVESSKRQPLFTQEDDVPAFRPG